MKPSESIEQLKQYVRTLEGAIQLLATVMEDQDWSSSNAELRQLSEHISKLDPESEYIGQHVSRLEEQLVAIEKDIAQTDFAVPMPKFRPLFLENDIPPIFIVRYARLMGSRDLGTGIRRDRFEFVVNRLFLHGQTATPYKVARREKWDKLLQEIAPDSAKVDPGKVEETVEYLNEMEERIKGFESLDDLIDSKVYLELRGYKLTLRNDLLHPDILYAVGRVNVFLGNQIEQLVDGRSYLERRVRAALGEQSREADEVFGKEDGDEFAGKRRALRSAGETTQSRMKAITVDAPVVNRGTNRVFMLVGILLVIGGGVLALHTALRDKSSLDEMEYQDVVAISPYLQEGHMSEGGYPTVFYGQVTRDWPLMSNGQKEKALVEIQESLGLRNIQNALIMYEGTTILQLSHGKALDFRMRKTENSQHKRGVRKKKKKEE